MHHSFLKCYAVTRVSFIQELRSIFKMKKLMTTPYQAMGNEGKIITKWVSFAFVFV